MNRKWFVILFVTGILIVLFPHIAQIYHQYMQKNDVERFQMTSEMISEEKIEMLHDKAITCNEQIITLTEKINDPFDSNHDKLSTFNECLGIEDNTMFGAIEIPKLQLMIPIYLGSSEDVLRKGIGHVEGSSLPLGGKGTHSVLAGHRGMGTKAMFRNIDQLDVGDIIYIYTMGETLTYIINGQEVIYPHETESLNIREDKDLVTLLTCHPYRHNYQRLLVQAERKGSPPAK